MQQAIDRHLPLAIVLPHFVLRRLKHRGAVYQSPNALLHVLGDRLRRQASRLLAGTRDDADDQAQIPRRHDVDGRAPPKSGCGCVSMRYRSQESACGHWFMSTWASLCLSGTSCQSGTHCPRLPRLMESSLPAFNSRLTWSLDFPASLPNKGTGRLLGDS